MVARSPLRILHITEAASAGVGRHVLDLAAGQLARGHDVSVVYSGRRVDEMFRQRACSLDRLRTYRVDMHRAPHVSDVVVVKSIRWILKKSGPFDVVHGHSSKGGAIARLVGRISGASVVYTPNCIYTMNQQANRWAFYLTRSVERRLERRTDAIIAVSPDEQDHIVALGISRQKVHCVVNGVTESFSTDRHAARARLGLDSAAVVVGFLGRLSQQKNPLLLLEAFARLVHVPNVRLAIAGDGELQHALRAAAQGLSLVDRVHWLGHRTAAEVFPALDVFALTSHYEGMPYVLLEALSAGLPIVATDVSGARLVIREGENGYIVPRASADEMARAIHKLIASAERREQFGAVSRSLAEQFTIDRMVDETVAVYAQALSGSVLR